MNTDSKTEPETSATQGGKAVAPTKKTVIGAASKAARPAKAPKDSQRSRSPSSTDKLICRYCGSDDLAPSFLKRRDARCRACFKKRYASAAREQKTTRPRKTKAAK